MFVEWKQAARALFVIEHSGISTGVVKHDVLPKVNMDENRLIKVKTFCYDSSLLLVIIAIEPHHLFWHEQLVLSCIFVLVIVFLLLCLCSLSGKTSYSQNPWRLKATRLVVFMIVSLWNLAGSAAEVPVKFQSDWESLNSKPMAARLHDILR